MPADVAVTTVKIKYTCACDRCGAVNTKEDRDMSLEDFNVLSRSFPKEYWREDGASGTVFRFHEENMSGRCSRSC